MQTPSNNKTNPMKTMHLVIALAGIFAGTACSTDKPGDTSRPEAGEPWAPARLTSVKGIPAAEIESALRSALDGSKPEKIDEEQWTHTKNLYKAYGNQPLWLSPDGLHEDRAYALANSILQAEQDGMRMDAYPIGNIARAMSAVAGKTAPTAQQLAETDVLLTAAFAAIGEDYLTGQIDPKSVAQSWHIDPQEENVDSALVRSLRTAELEKAFAAMRPQSPDYVALRRELDRYQKIVQAGGWPSVPRGDATKPGESMSAVRVTALKQRLAAEGILPAESAATVTPASQTQPSAAAVYDRNLAGAVARFQARHGIVVDSMLGKETFDALNKPAAYRAAQIAANLERMRWMPRTLGSRYIIVNVSAFHLEAYDNGQKALEMRVIVGEDYEDKATPVFSDSMETVVFRPYWNVTDDIAEKELFPKINADPGYLAANNYELYREGGKTRIRQKPGEENSLGLVKFLFPNDFNIYLHDTPNRELFEKDVRAFSHGCIRVEKPNELAQWALGWDAARVEAAMKGSDNQTIKVPQKIPVFISYGTAYIRDGQLFFGNDLYSRDAKMVDEVFRGAIPAPQTVQAVEALRRIAARS